MSSFNLNSNLNSTVIKSNNNNNLYSNNNNSNIKNDVVAIERNSSASQSPTNLFQIKNLQQNRRDSQKSDDDNPFRNPKDLNVIPTAVSPHEIEGVRYGKCKWFNVAKGWGFITPNDGTCEVFVHQSVIQMSGFRSLGEQEDVEFECHVTERGLEATRVCGRQGDNLLDKVIEQTRAEGSTDVLEALFENIFYYEHKRTDCHGSTFRPHTKKRNRRVRCYNCGEFANHIASKCHLGPQPKRCHLCKQDDHLFANCPTKKNQINETAQHSTNETTSVASEDGTNVKPDMTNENR